MNIPYRTRRRLKRIGTVALFLLMVFILFWFCWVIWVERYIVYTREGATIDFSLSSENLAGEVAVPPAAGEGPGIHFNEGENAINTSTEMTQLSGYYITAKMLAEDLAGVRERVAALPANTAVMIELKGGYGSFYYSTDLADATRSASVDVAGVDALIEEMNSKNLYLIAQISAFQDYTFALANVSTGIPFTGGGGALWMDDEGCYWLKPKDSAVLGYLTTIILELRGRGFDEVVLSDFMVPNGERVLYEGDAAADLQEAANKLTTTCTTTAFTLSFSVSSPSFALPEGRTRMYLSGVSAKDVEITAAQATVTDPQIQLVFIADTNDTRYEAYSVLRSLDVAEELEE